MTKDEALKLAIEILESSRIFVMSREVIKRPEGADWYDSRITAIKEALAQPEQEPVAWYHNDFGSVELSRIPRAGWKPLYTSPPMPMQERNFCQRCGKRTADLTTIHTCTPPQENT